MWYTIHGLASLLFPRWRQQQQTHGQQAIHGRLGETQINPSKALGLIIEMRSKLNEAGGLTMELRSKLNTTGGLTMELRSKHSKTVGWTMELRQQQRE